MELTQIEKDFIVNEIIKMVPQTVRGCCMAMKIYMDNFFQCLEDKYKTDENSDILKPKFDTDINHKAVCDEELLEAFGGKKNN